MTVRTLALAGGLLIAGLALYASFPPTGQGAQPAPHDLNDRLKACTGCHGDQGRAGPDGYYPRIAGKPEGYLLQQLLHFREGRRQGPSMAWMVQGLRDESLEQIASYFSKQHPAYPPTSTAAVAAATALGPAALRRGEQLARQGDATRQLPACADCHGEKLTGIAPAMPGLLGLPRDYLNAQLGAWRNGERKAAAPDCMADIAKALTPDDLIAVTTWLAAQPVPGDGRAEQIASGRFGHPLTASTAHAASFGQPEPSRWLRECGTAAIHQTGSGVSQGLTGERNSGSPG
ncbi:MAG: c-type cytochrome, partial [Burkholderiales bacterium]